MHHRLTSLLAVLIVFAGRPAGAQIVNGSFESDYAGWTLWEGDDPDPDAGPCNGVWGIGINGFSLLPNASVLDYYHQVPCNVSGPGLPLTFVTTDGDQLAFQIPIGAQFHRMYQDVAVPANANTVLHWDMRYHNHSTWGFDDGMQHVAVRVRDTSDTVLETLYITTNGTDPLEIPMRHFSADLSAYAGTTIRLSVEVRVMRDFFETQFDNFYFEVTKNSYPFSGFFSPVDNPPTLNRAKAGSAIPLKFSLSSDLGLNILESGYPASQRAACDTFAPVDVITETIDASESSLSFDSLTGMYTYVWKSEKGWAGQCRTLSLKLTDGTVHTAQFQIHEVRATTRTKSTAR